jgi:hypothetical protein
MLPHGNMRLCPNPSRTQAHVQGQMCRPAPPHTHFPAQDATTPISAPAGLHLNSLPLCLKLAWTTACLPPQCGSHKCEAPCDAWHPPKHKMPLSSHTPCLGCMEITSASQLGPAEDISPPPRAPAQDCTSPTSLCPKQAPSTARLLHEHVRLLHAPLLYTGPSNAHLCKTVTHPTRVPFSECHLPPNQCPLRSPNQSRFLLLQGSIHSVDPTSVRLPARLVSLHCTGCLTQIPA